MRFLGLASVAGIIGVAGAAGAITLRGGSAVTETSSGNISLHQEGVAKPPAAKARVPRMLAATPAARPAPVSVPAAEPAMPTSPALAPPPPAATASQSVAGSGSVLGPGRTTLADSIFALRSGDSVNVNFDTKGNRTRRADKFEHMVRLTLPMVYGRRVSSALDSIPEGLLVPSRDLMGVATAQGVHLRLDNGTKIALWPQTRESTDGPLVIAYWVVVER